MLDSECTLMLVGPKFYVCTNPHSLLTAYAGYKGASILIVHSPFDMVKGVAIDSLHVFFLGVVQDLLKYWFDKHYRTSSFSIYSKVNDSCK